MLASTDLNQSLRDCRITAVVNTASGGCTAESADQIAEVFADAELQNARVVSVGPEAVEGALHDAVATSDVMAVLGGDGTIRTAGIICGEAGKLLIPLAGGTLNWLPHALYGAIPWARALTDTLAAPRIRDVSGGDAGGQRFFCAAVFGAPSLWADTREALREGDLAKAAEGAVTAIRRHSDALSYRFGDEARAKAEAVVVMCPLVSRSLAADEQALEAAALDPTTALDMLGLAFNAIFNDWRNDASVKSMKVDQVRVRGHGQLPAILDGERTTFERTISVTFVPVAFRALVPDATPSAATPGPSH